jgi:hypothetical protein
MFDPTVLQSRAVFPHPERFFALAVDHAAQRAYCGSSDRAIYVFDVAGEKREPLARWEGHANYVSALALVETPAGPRLVSGSFDRSLRWWDLASGQAVHAASDAHAGWIRDVVVIPGQGLVATAADDMAVKLWNAADPGAPALVRTLTGHAVRTPPGHVTALYCLAASADGQFLAAGDRVGEVRVWNVTTGELAQVFQVPVLYTYDPRQRKRSIGGIRSLAFSPDGTQIAAGGIGLIDNVDGLQGPLTVELWDWRQPARLATLAADGHQAMVQALAFHPSEPWLAGAGGGSGNGIVAFWKTDALSAAPAADPSNPDQAAPDQAVPPLNAGHKLTFDGHPHRLTPDAGWTKFHAAGHGKLEVWRA